MAKKCLIVYLAVALLIMGAVPRVDAAFVASEKVNFAADRAGNLEKIRSVLENKLVSQRLQDLGYTTEEVKVRLSEMTDNQIHNLAQNLDSIKVGQDGEAAVIIIVLLIVVVILVYLQATGRRIIISK